MQDDGFFYVINFSDTLSICLTMDPTFRGSQDPSSCWIGLIFDAADKEALFFHALNIFDPVAAVGGRVPAREFYQGKWNDLVAQFERSFEQATATLPMLRRFKEEYEDVAFSPSEVNCLRDECLRVRSSTDDPGALTSLGKLILACDEALGKGSGLFFASD